MRRRDKFAVDNYYHVCNRGVERREIFLSERDFQRFIETLEHCLLDKRKPSKRNQKPINKVSIESPVEVVAFCLMTNHFHLLLKQHLENGLVAYLQRLSNSYAKYFNTKYKREGPLFQGPFKSVRMESEEHLLHLSRYIHLNPVVAGLVEDPKAYKWSSYNSYINSEERTFVKPQIVLGQFSSIGSYKKFTLDQIDYAKKLEELKHLNLD